MKKRILIIVCIAALFTSCGLMDKKRVSTYADTEIETKKGMISDVLKSFEIEAAEIYSMAHLRYGSPELKKQLHSESYTGTGPAMEGPPGEEGSVPPNDAEEMNSSYNNYELTVDYDGSRKKAASLDYISFLIIVDSQYEDRSARLKEALESLILNKQRADVLTVITR